MRVLEDDATYWIEEHVDGIRLSVDDRCEAVSAILSPDQWEQLKIAGDKVLRRRR
jgi:hypothetical protein